MKKVFWILLAVVCAMGLASCGGSDDDDNGSGAQGISGPAILRVKNEVPYVQQISFDGTYIGDVAVNSSRDWNVPAGTHVVDGYDSVTGHSQKSYNFIAGRVTSIRLYIRSAKVAVDEVETAKIIEVVAE